jgi:protein involved in polysaccharide export with SLBB domain
MERRAKELKVEIDRAESELSKAQEQLATASSEDEKRLLEDSIQSQRKQIDKLHDRYWTLTQDIAQIKARREAIDRGEYPEALLMDEIEDDPRLFELRQRLKEVEELYEHTKSIARYPTDPAVLRYAARLRFMKEAENRLIADLLEVARNRLRSGTAQSRQTKGTVQGTQTSPGGQTKIFSLRNSQAAEAYEMLSKLYPEDAVRMTTDGRTNSLIVEGDRETLEKIEAILLRLDEEKSPDSKAGATKIQHNHVLRISVAGTLADAPLKGLYTIDLDGYVNLGAQYGKVKVTGLTADQAEAAILKILREILREPKVVLSIEAASPSTPRSNTTEDRRSSGPVRIQSEAHALRIRATGTLTNAPIDGVYHLDLDGYVNLGAEYGKIKIAGLTADEAEKAVLSELAKVLREPKVTLTVEGRTAGPHKAESGPSKSRKIVELENANAEACAKMIRSLFVPETATAHAMDQSKSVLVEASADALAKIEGMLAKVDYSEGARGRTVKLRESLPLEFDRAIYVVRGYERLAEIKDELDRLDADPSRQATSTVEQLREEFDRETGEVQNDVARLREWTCPPELTIKTVIQDDQLLKVAPGGKVVESLPLTAELLTAFEIETAKQIAHEYRAAVLRLPHRKNSLSGERTEQARPEEPPIQLSHAAEFQRELGKLALRFELAPSTVVKGPSPRNGEGERAMPQYFLVIEGPKLGRRDHVLSNWPDYDEKRRLHRLPGVIFAPRKPTISDGEPLEIYIERDDAPASNRVRASNIVKLTWDLSDSVAQQTTQSHSTTEGPNSLRALEAKAALLREELAKTKALAYQKDDEIFELSLEATKSGKDLSDESKSKLEALKRVKDQLVERVTKLEREIQSHSARTQEIQGQPRSSSVTTPAARPRRGQEQESEAEQRQKQLQALQEQLKFVEQQLNSQIPNVRDTLETRILKRERDDLQRQIFELQRHHPMIERVRESAPGDPLANHPELVPMRRRLGDLNAKIGQERLHQEGAKESAYLRALTSQSQRLQNAIWELEKTLQP